MGKKRKKLPKEIAGVKIPKKLRRKGGRLIAALDTPVGRELAAAGLMAAAAAIARHRKAPDRPAPAPDDAPPSDAGAAEPVEAGEPPHRDPHAAGAAFANAAASAAAGVAVAALDRWLKHKSAADPRPPRAPAPPSGTTH